MASLLHASGCRCLMASLLFASGCRCLLASRLHRRQASWLVMLGGVATADGVSVAKPADGVAVAKADGVSAAQAAASRLVMLVGAATADGVSALPEAALLAAVPNSCTDCPTAALPKGCTAQRL